MNTLLSTLVEQRNDLLDLLDERPPAPSTHTFTPVVRYGTDKYGFAAAYPDIDGALGCATCGASRLNPLIHE